MKPFIFYKEFRKPRSRKVNSLKEIKVLVVGDVMLDHYIYGSATRISPEAPVPVVLKKEEKFYLGGAGNVFSNIISLGGKADLLTVLGKDSESEKVLSLIKELTDKSDNNTSLIFQSSDRKTTIKSRVMSGGHQMLRIDDETTDPVNKDLEDLILERFSSECNNYSGVVLQDYNKGVLTPKVIEGIINKCKENNIPVIVDPKKNNIDCYRGATILKPNFSEFCNMTGKEIDPNDDKSVANHSSQLRKKMDIENLVITMSDLGIYFSSNECNCFSPAYEIKVSDVSGAGDTVLSMLTLCYLAGTEINSMLYFCNLAGSIACSKVGAISVTLSEIENHPSIKEKFGPDKKFILY